jgi:hypothetical protein
MAEPATAFRREQVFINNEQICCALVKWVDGGPLSLTQLAHFSLSIAQSLMGIHDHRMTRVTLIAAPCVARSARPSVSWALQ